jgi:hypothetical protein
MAAGARQARTRPHPTTSGLRKRSRGCGESVESVAVKRGSVPRGSACGCIQRVCIAWLVARCAVQAQAAARAPHRRGRGNMLTACEFGHVKAVAALLSENQRLLEVPDSAVSAA